MYMSLDQLNDIIGKKFGKLEVQKYLYNETKFDNIYYYYQCKCDCGKETTVEREQLINGGRQSCGCNGGTIKDLNDIIGKRYGMLVVLKYHHSEYLPGHLLNHFYLCKCDCGNETIAKRNMLFYGKRTSCGCAGKIQDLNDIVDKKYGKLTVIAYDHYDTETRCNYYRCKCECGNEIVVRRRSLTSGHTKTCGASIHHTTHGMWKTRFYEIWNAMLNRCNCPNSKSYQYYGGRGISVCDRWLSFENFRDDMYESYLTHAKIHTEKDTTIERINVNGNYCPENCRWATKEEQANNKTTTHFVTYRGETMSLTQFAKKYETPTVSASTIVERVLRGYDLDISMCDVVAHYNGKPVIKAISFTNKEV